MEEPGSLEWLLCNWDSLPEQQVCTVKKWLMSGNDVALPGAVQAIHEECRLWLEERGRGGEGCVDGWLDYVLGRPPRQPPIKVLVERCQPQQLPPLSSAAAAHLHSTPKSA